MIFNNVIAYSGWCLYLGVSANTTTMGFLVIMRYNKVSSLNLPMSTDNILSVSLVF